MRIHLIHITQIFICKRCFLLGFGVERKMNLEL